MGEPSGGTVKVYVASSWRNEWQAGVVVRLRDDGFEVYDFRHPHQTGPDRGRMGRGFAWSEIDPDWQEWSPGQYRAALNDPRAVNGYLSDLDALLWADAVVMVQPAGRSAALELGFAAGAGKFTVVLLHKGEPELMLKMADALCLTTQEVIDVLHEHERVAELPQPVQGITLPRER